LASLSAMSVSIKDSVKGVKEIQGKILAVELPSGH
jgi:hypothetical protein